MSGDAGSMKHLHREREPYHGFSDGRMRDERS
jgi:hypothetical protein